MPRHRRRKRWALALGPRSRVKIPFLLPSTRNTPGPVMKSAKFQTCSPTTASTRSKTRCDISRMSTWYSSVHGIAVTLWSPATVSPPYSVMMTGLPCLSAHARSSASRPRSAPARSPVLTYQPCLVLAEALEAERLPVDQEPGAVDSDGADADRYLVGVDRPVTVAPQLDVEVVVVPLARPDALAVSVPEAPAGLVPALVMLAAAGVMLGYRLTEKSFRLMVAEIAHRRAATEVPPVVEAAT